MPDAKFKTQLTGNSHKAHIPLETNNLARALLCLGGAFLGSAISLSVAGHSEIWVLSVALSTLGAACLGVAFSGLQQLQNARLPPLVTPDGKNFRQLGALRGQMTFSEDLELITTEEDWDMLD